MNRFGIYYNILNMYYKSMIYNFIIITIRTKRIKKTFCICIISVILKSKLNVLKSLRAINAFILKFITLTVKRYEYMYTYKVHILTTLDLAFILQLFIYLYI